jgi:hypothetical protein
MSSAPLKIRRLTPELKATEDDGTVPVRRHPTTTGAAARG